MTFPGIELENAVCKAGIAPISARQRGTVQTTFLKLSAASSRLTYSSAQFKMAHVAPPLIKIFSLLSTNSESSFSHKMASRNEKRLLNIL